MKSQIKVIITAILCAGGIFFSCSDSSTDPGTGGEVAKNYFPSNNGSFYTYDLEITDSLGSKTTATRTATYSNTETINSQSYQILIDEFNFPGYSISDSSYFRKTDSNVFYFADNTQAMILVPDSLISLIRSDNEAALLSFPLNTNYTWNVYKLGIDFGFFLFNVVNVNANVVGLENISLTVNNEVFNREAMKLKFTMAIALDMNSLPMTFTADAWFVDGVGLVKLEGNTEAINFMLSHNLFLPGGNVKQTLRQYSIP